ncbi:MAG: UvrD-helicase domain-containing protein, partial [Desulfobulbaceae bacterium]|nr:UvrD-helicase domain-containing protein [Desulfobulbaceae bacterium]
MQQEKRAGKLQYIADLHIHSPYSRATSKTSHLHGLAAWAAIKGIDVVGTGDFTHPVWLNHLQENLVPAEPGFFRLKDTDPARFSDVVPAGLEPDISRIRFVLTAEISSIYKRGGRVRKIHNILFAPDLASVRRLNTALAAIGNLESDGRPILGLDSRNLLEILLEKAPEGFLVPAHIWTPWFSLFGSKSGFDSIEECFGDLAEHIFALETGLSSDPDMNRTISALDSYSLISNSDCHSPGKLGREANILSTGFDFFSMREALRSPADSSGRQRFVATIEFYPEEGKYHCDGHRKCRVCMEPRETRDHGGICPSCGRPLTVGVLYRVMELADRTAPVYPAGSPAVHSLVPLPELLGELLQVGPASKKVMAAYVKLIEQFGSEFAILLHADPGDLERGSSPVLAEAIQRMRSGNVIRRPGYDGEFGVIRVFTDSERQSFGGQMNLFAPTEPQKTRKKPGAVNKIPFASKKKKKEKKKELNPEQLQIVESEAHHIIVKAGPGTGKTHTLLQRLVRVAASGDCHCTVITFTNKAAKELEMRLRSLSSGLASIDVSTMHGYCLKWLRRYKPGVKVAGPEMRRWFLQSLCDRGLLEHVGEMDGEITAFLQQAPDLRRPLPGRLEPYFA